MSKNGTSQGNWHDNNSFLARLNKLGKKIMIKAAKSDLTEIVLFFLILFIMVIIMSCSKDVTLSDATSRLFDPTLFGSAIVAALITIAAKRLRSSLYNKVEDTIKLESDVTKLKKYYKRMDFEDASDINNAHRKNWEDPAAGDEIIPVNFCADLSGDVSIIIKDNKESFYEPPAFIQQNFNTLIAAHRSSKLYNNLNIRVHSWQLKDDSFMINTERTYYFYSMATNRVMDYELEGGLSVRRMMVLGEKLEELQDSKLSNHLGFNGMVESSDGMYPLVFRSKDVSIGKRTFANSIGASLKTKYALEDGVFTKAGLDRAVREEICDELCVTDDSIEELRYVCAYRDYLEGGKPQLFIYAKVKETSREIDERFTEKQQKKNEQRKYLSKEDIMKTDGDTMIWIKKEEVMNRMLIYANHISARFTSYNEDKTKEGDRDIVMVPSAIGCMLFFSRYLDSYNN